LAWAQRLGDVLRGALLFAVKPRDPLTFAVVTGLLAIVALVACWLQARRAGKAI
jgi:hypothetical protein